AVLSTEHHAHDETLGGAVIPKRRLEPLSNPALNSVKAVPSSSLNRNQPRVSDVTGPVHALPLEIPPVIEHTRISINRRTMKVDRDLELVCGQKVESVKHGELPRIIQKFR